MASYYDAIGLLAICDAIDSVEGVPLSTLSSKPIANQPPLPPSKASPNTNSQTPNSGSISANHKSTHVPTPDPSKCESDPSLYPYPYPPKSSTEKKPYTSSLSRLTPFRYDGSGMDDTSSATTLQSYPMFYAQPLQHLSHDDSVLLKGDEKAYSPAISSSHTASQLPNFSRHYSVTKTNDTHSHRKRDQRNSRKLSSSYSDLPTLSINEKSSPSKLLQTGSSFSSSQLPEANRRPPLIIGGYKVEECPICGRNFKGPKASTHKQQHIRRLHPEDYTPKRGGKKRVVIDSPPM